jgi:hypothetical protein
MSNSGPDEMERVSLCEAIDRILNKGAVVTGDVVISVADIDLVYLGLQLILTSIETARVSANESNAEKEMTYRRVRLGPRCGMELRNALE